MKARWVYLQNQHENKQMSDVATRKWGSHRLKKGFATKKLGLVGGH